MTCYDTGKKLSKYYDCMHEQLNMLTFIFFIINMIDIRMWVKIKTIYLLAVQHLKLTLKCNYIASQPYAYQQINAFI